MKKACWAQSAILTGVILAICTDLYAEQRVIFFDDFNTTESYHKEVTKNATAKVYQDNALAEGHLLKKWNYNWEYHYLEGDWKQAFYCVPVGEDYMIQAGRSGVYYNIAPYRITANVPVPEAAREYTITLRQYKHDNDPLYYLLGANKVGFDGVSIGYMNQLPGTDNTVSDAYLKGSVLEGLIRPGMSFQGEWVDVVIQVDVETKVITWTIDGEEMAKVYARELKPGGYFGIAMHYERNTRFDDIKISVVE